MKDAKQLRKGRVEWTNNESNKEEANGARKGQLKVK